MDGCYIRTRAYVLLLLCCRWMGYTYTVEYSIDGRLMVMVLLGGTGRKARNIKLTPMDWTNDILCSSSPTAEPFWDRKCYPGL